nr:zinc finger, CCHC-type [Tanacetum cinerariifolium]
MGDANPIRTLGDYSKPSYEGYRNTIKLPLGNNVVPLRSDTIRIDLWLKVQIFYDRIDHTLKRTVDYAARGWLRKLSAEKAWATIKELARYEDEGWNDLVTPREGSLNYKMPKIEQLLGVMKCKVDTLMKEVISLMGRSESIFRMTSNTVYQLPSEPCRQEEFRNLVMNFILDQEEKVKQLEEYMGVIGSDFMQLSSENTLNAQPKSTVRSPPSQSIKVTPTMVSQKRMNEKEKATPKTLTSLN